MRYLLAALALQVMAITSCAQVCDTTSGQQTAALVELYTSEGCSSCPTADAWIVESPAAKYRPGQVVPLALHVPYWDDIGWRDVFAQQGFAVRQSRLVGLNGHRTVITPHFFVSGKEVLEWRSGIEAEIRRVIARPADTRIDVRTELARRGILAIDVAATAQAGTEGLQLFIAVTENKLSSVVNAGENRGTTLRHDHVVRVLIGPLPMSNGRAAERKELSIDSTWQVAQLSVAAFVQDASSGRVLQAVSTTPCRLVR